MASVIPILEPTASLRDVIFARNAAQESQQFMAKTMIDSGRRVAAAIGVSVAKKEAAKLAPMLQMRYMDAYNDIAAGDTAMGLSKTVGIGAEISANPFLQRIAEEGNALAGQMVQHKEAMAREVVGQEGAFRRTVKSGEVSTDIAELNAGVNVYESESRSLQAQINDESKYLDELKRQYAQAQQAGYTQEELSQIKAQIDEEATNLKDLHTKLNSLSPTAIPWKQNGDLPVNPVGAENPDGGPSGDPLSPTVILEKEAVEEAASPGAVPESAVVPSETDAAANPASAQPTQVSVQPETKPTDNKQQQSGGFPQEVPATLDEPTVNILGGMPVFRLNGTGKNALATAKEFGTTAIELKDQLLKSDSYKAIQDFNTLFATRTDIQNTLMRSGGVEFMKLETKDIGEGKNFILGISKGGEFVPLPGPRTEDGIKKYLTLTADEKNSLDRAKSTIKGKGTLASAAWYIDFTPTGKVETTADGKVTHTKDVSDFANPEVGDRVPPTLTQGDVAVIASQLTGGKLTPEILASKPELAQNIRNRLWDAWDSLTGGGTDATEAAKRIKEADYTRGEINKIATPEIKKYLESLKGADGKPIFKIAAKQEVEKSFAEELNKTPLPENKTTAAIKTSVSNFIKSENLKINNSIKANKILSNAIGINERLNQGVINVEPYVQAMEELKEKWDKLGAKTSLYEAMEKAKKPKDRPAILNN